MLCKIFKFAARCDGAFQINLNGFVLAQDFLFGSEASLQLGYVRHTSTI